MSCSGTFRVRVSYKHHVFPSLICSPATFVTALSSCKDTQVSFKALTPMRSILTWSSKQVILQNTRVASIQRSQAARSVLAKPTSTSAFAGGSVSNVLYRHSSSAFNAIAWRPSSSFQGKAIRNESGVAVATRKDRPQCRSTWRNRARALPPGSAQYDMLSLRHSIVQGYNALQY